MCPRGICPQRPSFSGHVPRALAACLLSVAGGPSRCAPRASRHTRSSVLLQLYHFGAMLRPRAPASPPSFTLRVSRRLSSCAFLSPHHTLARGAFPADGRMSAKADLTVAIRRHLGTVTSRPHWPSFSRLSLMSSHASTLQSLAFQTRGKARVPWTGRSNVRCRVRCQRALIGVRQNKLQVSHPRTM